VQASFVTLPGIMQGKAAKSVRYVKYIIDSICIS